MGHVSRQQCVNDGSSTYGISIAASSLYQRALPKEEVCYRANVLEVRHGFDLRGVANDVDREIVGRRKSSLCVNVREVTRHASDDHRRITQLAWYGRFIVPEPAVNVKSAYANRIVIRLVPSGAFPGLQWLYPIVELYARPIYHR